MRRLIRFALPAALTALVAAGCGKKDESKPNPDLQIPDVPPSSHGSKGELKDSGKK